MVACADLERTPLTTKLFGLMDIDGSGEIDFEEFMQAVTGKMSEIFADMNKQLEEQVFGSQVR